ncbi:hypothetical protein [Desulforamulus ferrireducens]|uniref:hypothetical protein n=1 Tax=Desulforamulus ferrireducens TaxID=1833852 RepID=UPI001356436E|nr:hypothetical protein [Desulforamulus ferrireducens]
MSNQDFYAGLFKPYQEGLKKLKGVQGLPEIVLDNYKAIKEKAEQHEQKMRIGSKQA